MTSTAFDDQFAAEPAEHIADASTMRPATSIDSVTSAIMGAFRMLVAAGNRLASEYEEFEGPDGMAIGIGLDYWHEFAEALERAHEALATPTPNQAHQATPSDADLFNLVRDLNDHDIKMLPLMAASRLVRAAIARFSQPGPQDSEHAAMKSARDEGFTAGTIAALAILAAHDSETQWREVLHVANQEKVIYHAAHIEPEDWEWAGFAKYIGKKPPKHRAARKAKEQA